MFDFKLCPSGQTKPAGGEAGVEDIDIEQSVKEEKCLKLSKADNNGDTEALIGFRNLEACTRYEVLVFELDTVHNGWALRPASAKGAEVAKSQVVATLSDWVNNDLVVATTNPIVS